MRAIAVVAVVLFHAFPALAPSGFAGVDVFFVISGFVITEGLRRRAHAGTGSLLDFYGRRIRRLFPALAVVLAATLALCWFVLLPGEYEQTATLAAAAGVSLTNLQLLRESGYFDVATTGKPLMHLWSLGVEEQFYLVWPLLLFWCGSSRKSLAAAGAIALVSFVLAASWSVGNPVHAFFNPLSRGWELLAGASLAWIPSAWRSPRGLRTLGLGLVAIALLLQGGPSERLMIIVMSVCGTAMVIAAGNGGDSSRLLSAGVLQWLGAISYPLYLWHWPVLALRNLLGGGESSSTLFTIGWIGAALLLAHATHVIVERRVASAPTRGVAALCVAALALPVAAAVMVKAFDGAPDRWVAHRNAKAATGTLRAGKELSVPECVSAREGPEAIFCARDASGPPDAAIWGDSKGEALYWGLLRESRRDGSGKWMLLGSSGCPGSDAGLGAPTCGTGRPLAWEAVGGAQVRTVVLVSAARGLEGPREKALFEQAASSLVSSGKTVLVVMDNPTVTGEHEKPSACARELQVPFLDRLAQQRTCNLRYSAHLAATAAYRQWLGGLLASHPAIALFDPAPLLCDVPSDLCPVAKDGKLLYSYGDHISDAANSMIAREILKLLKDMRDGRRAGPA